MAIFEASVSNILSLNDSIIVAGPVSLAVSSKIELVDTFVFVQVPTRAANNLSLPDATDLDPNILPDPSDPEFQSKMTAILAGHGLRDSVSVTRPITNLTVVDLLKLSDSAAHPIELSVSNHIELSHAVRDDVFNFIVEDVIIFGQEAIGFVGEGISDPISFTSVATVVAVRSLSVTDTLLIVDSISESLSNTPVTCTNFNLSSTVQFTFPFTTPTLTVTLRSPDLGNADTLNFRRISRRDRGGKLEIFRRDIWPKTKRMRLQFSSLTDLQRRQILQILNESLGQDVRYKDHENRNWKGIFTTPSAKIQEIGRECDNEITIEFQGELV